MSLQQHEDAFQKVIEIVESAKQQTFRRANKELIKT